MIEDSKLNKSTKIVSAYKDLRSNKSNIELDRSVTSINSDFRDVKDWISSDTRMNKQIKLLMKENNILKEKLEKCYFLSSTT